jgi:cytochrome c oxidase subunit IV
MAMLRKVKAVMRTLVEISSVQEIPELKTYLRMTLVEMMMSWKAKKIHARMALMKWMTLKTSLIFIGPAPSSAKLSLKMRKLSSFLFL